MMSRTRSTTKGSWISPGPSLLLALFLAPNVIAQITDEQREEDRQHERDMLDQSIVPPDDEDNAARLYRQAFDELISISQGVHWSSIM